MSNMQEDMEVENTTEEQQKIIATKRTDTGAT